MTTHYGDGHWETQLPVDYKNDSLVINTWETVSSDLSGGKPAKLRYFIIEQTNTGAAVEDIVIEITIPHPVTGVATALTFTIANSASGIPYYVYITRDLSTGWFYPWYSQADLHIGTESADQTVPFTVGYIGLVRERQTTAVDGVAAQIEVNIVWEKLVDY